jgi:hypothetical protein
MKRSFVRRIEKLELMLQSRVRPAAVFRYGSIRYLPPDTVGERHIAIVKTEPTALPLRRSPKLTHPYSPRVTQAF